MNDVIVRVLSRAIQEQVFVYGDVKELADEIIRLRTEQKALAAEADLLRFDNEGCRGMEATLREENREMFEERERLQAELEGTRNGTEAVSYGLAYLEMQETIAELTAERDALLLSLAEICRALVVASKTGSVPDMSDWMIRAADLLKGGSAIAKATGAAVEEGT